MPWSAFVKRWRRDGTGVVRTLARAVDELLEATVVGSFSRIGISVRRRLERWGDPPRVDGASFVVTGASSGIGRAVAVQLARLGGAVWLVGRDPARTAEAARSAAAGGHGPVRAVVLDVVDVEAVQSFADDLARSVPRLDGLVHGAGALLPRYRTAPDGTELTVATHVLAPFRLTWLLAPLLRRGGRSAIVTVSSGGMYTEGFDLGRLEMPAARYRGATAYARAKRAQVVLSHEWARRWGADGVASHAMHPGWVDTPGLASGLPSFTRLGRLLRTPAEGADTAVWLAAGGPRSGGPAAEGGSGVAALEGFWHDRRRRREHRLPGTKPRAADAASAGPRLWEWCAARTGVGLGPGGPVPSA